ncbi:hypothetical protein, partial [Pseudomonas atacamensis]|uniref:hypothetical protein n=1 Tax=Pseudomonas atacamensis TaxID=2565368 RepID=UPI002B1D14D2
RELIALFGRGTPTWNIASNADHEKRNDLRSKAPHPNPLPEGEGTDRVVWSRYADLEYRVERRS